jgi:hypothetical protein
MEVNSSSRRIEKFSGRPCTIFLRELKATFSIVVCELELKYGANYTEVFAFKQLARYVHYEALDVYEQHFLRILDVTQIPNVAYATTIVTRSHAPWLTQSEFKYETTERLRARGTLPSFQHLKGVEGRAGASGWDYEE